VTAYQPKIRAALACSGKFSVFSSLILSCKRIKRTVVIGFWLQSVAMLLGFLIFAAMVVTKSFGELTVSMVMAYCTVFTLILLALQLLRKS
jgi:hypothetical protein